MATTATQGQDQPNSHLRLCRDDCTGKQETRRLNGLLMIEGCPYPFDLLDFQEIPFRVWHLIC